MELMDVLEAQFHELVDMRRASDAFVIECRVIADGLDVGRALVEAGVADKKGAR